MTVEKKPWTLVHWSIAVVLVFALHFLVIYLLNEPDEFSISAARVPKTLFVRDVAQHPALAEWLALHDPTVFTRASPRGFSDVNWLRASRQNYQTTKWNEPFRWLAPSEERFAEDFSRFVQETVPAVAMETTKVPPTFAQVQISPPPLPARAVLRIEGPLAAWSWKSHQPLPVNASPALLTNTLVGLTADSLGRTLSVTSIQSSGSPEADQNALAFARQLWFSPATNAPTASRKPLSDSLVFGNLVFQWFPAVARTNPLTAQP